MTYWWSSGDRDVNGKSYSFFHAPLRYFTSSCVQVLLWQFSQSNLIKKIHKRMVYFMPFTHRRQSILTNSWNYAFRFPFVYQFYVVGRAYNKTNKNKTEANLYISSDFTLCVQFNNLNLSQVKFTSTISLWATKEILCYSGSIFKD